MEVVRVVYRTHYRPAARGVSIEPEMAAGILIGAFNRAHPAAVQGPCVEGAGQSEVE